MDTVQEATAGNDTRADRDPSHNNRTGHRPERKDSMSIQDMNSTARDLMRDRKSVV